MMRKVMLGTVLAVVLVSTSVVNASITGWNCAADGDGAIVMGTPTWSEIGNEYQLSMAGTQHWAPAHVQGDFTTDTPTDPTVRIIEDVTNDTGFAWAGYRFIIGMSQSFTISTTDFTVPLGWSVTNTPTVAPGTIPNGGGSGYVAEVDFAGPPIANGTDASFGIKISFLGSIAYSTEQIPIPVPEPITVAMLALGGLCMLYRKR